MPESDSKRNNLVESCEVTDLVSSEDENEDAPSFASIVKKRSRAASGIDQVAKKDSSNDSSLAEVASNLEALKEDSRESARESGPRHSRCMPFLHADDRDDALVTDDIMPLLHQLNLSRVITSSGRNQSYPTCSSLLHIKQQDEWTCGFRNLQMLFSELLPLVPNHHAFFQYVPTSLRPYPDQENRPVPIPSLHQLQTFLEQSWKDGFDANGAEHYRHRIVGTRSWIGAVEVSTVLSYLQLDSAVVQFIMCRESRKLLGPFVWNYFCRGPCFSCHGNVSNTSCSTWAERLLYTKEEYKDAQDACPCPVLPLYLQWEGHSVTIVGVEKTKANEIHFLLFDPMKDGSQLKQALVSNQKDVLAPMRLPSTKLLTKDCQVVVCSPRQLTKEERDASRDRPRVVTAASDAVMRFM
jgi:hypothetical protein